MDHERFREAEAHIKELRAQVRSNRDTSEHFSSLAQEGESQLAYWTSEREKALGANTLAKVIAFPRRQQPEEDPAS